MSLPIPISIALSASAAPAVGDLVLGLLAALLVLAAEGLLYWLTYYLLSLPMRRQERARFFLDLLELTVAQQRPLEPTLVEMANSRDPALGMRFHLLAAHLEEGLRLGPALRKVPRLLPPQIEAMLRVGEKLGDWRKVLPACRSLLGDAPSSVRGAAGYLLLFTVALSPVGIFIMSVLALSVWPRFVGLTGQAAGGAVPVLNLTGVWPWLIAGQGCLFLVLLGSVILYVGGPRLVGWCRWGGMPLVDLLAWRVPWKRKRMQRNFSAMLAVLLDGGVPEPEAVRLAADGAANEVFRRRGERAAAAMAQGVGLTEAVQVADDTGEFRWRLANAVHAHGGFLRALSGWHEALEAKAFQQEQAAAHTITTALVVANGLVVALVAIAVFGTLVAIVNAGVLW
jgi:type II secretory pathway component PulF